jgi:glycosyltransferase involved in cell wall biosynthesis
MIAYDLIPYVLEADYLWKYRTAREAHHYSRRGALKAHVRRYMYISKISAATRRAYKVIAISEHTKNDFLKHTGIERQKIEVVHLGISEVKSGDKELSKPATVSRYVGTSWGDVRINEPLPNSPFLLFVGGADARRKLADLVNAFNLLRSQGHKISLILAGDTMHGPHSVPNAELHSALLKSSYINDIYMLGFIDDATREWLYANALAFVYPSRYEGFGLPVLEAMRYGTPVVTYKNSSISEIAGDNVLYATDPIEIAAAVKSLISEVSLAEQLRSKGRGNTANFTWQKTSKKILARVIDALTEPNRR